MNKLKKVKICGFLAALVTVFGIAGSQSTTKAIFFQSANKDLNAAYSAAKANPENMELWKRVKNLAENELIFMLLRANRDPSQKADTAQIVNAKTDVVYSTAHVYPGNAGLWRRVTELAESEVILLGANGDPSQIAYKAQLASAKANAAVGKLQAVVTDTRSQSDPRNIELLENILILSKREAAAWEVAENQANAARARENVSGTERVLFNAKLSKAQVAHANVSKAYAEVAEYSDYPPFWENLADLAKREATAWRAAGCGVAADNADRQADIFRAKNLELKK